MGGISDFIEKSPSPPKVLGIPSLEPSRNLAQNYKDNKASEPTKGSPFDNAFTRQYRKIDPIFGAGTKYVENYLGGAADIFSGFPDNIDLGKELPPEDKLINKLARDAASYDQNKEFIKQERGQTAASEINKDLARDVKGIKSNASSRGLLYSGLREGNEAGAYSDAANRRNVAQQKINQDVEEESNRKLANSLGIQYNLANQLLSPYDYAYDAAMKKRQSDFQTSKDIGGSVGGLAGSAYGNYSSKNSNYSNTTGRESSAAGKPLVSG